MQFINGCFETTKKNRKKVNFSPQLHFYTQNKNEIKKNYSNFDIYNPIPHI